jgi:hypothetical protein
MKPKTLALLVLFAACGASVFGQTVDFGGSLLNSTGLGNYPNIPDPAAPPTLAQRDVGNVWAQVVFNENLSLNVQLGGVIMLYEYAGPLKIFGDADLLNLQAVVPSPQEGLSLFKFTLGRAVYSDFTGLVLINKADGFSLQFDYPYLSVGLSFAYTGLLFKGSSSIAMSIADVNDVSYGDTAFLAPPRMLAILRLSVPSLYGQEINLSAIVQQDMRETAIDPNPTGRDTIVSAGSTTYDPTRGGPLNTQYLGLGVKGPIFGSLYYDVYSYGEAIQQLVYTDGAYETAYSFGLLAGAGARYFIPTALSSVIGAKFIYVSGDPSSLSIFEGNVHQFSNFIPISRPSFSYVFSPQLTNIMVAEASYSLKPLSFLGADMARNFDTLVKADVYFRSTIGAISEPAVPAGNTQPYLGTEADLTMNFRPLSDVGVSLWGGAFLPGAAFGTAAPLQYKAGIDVSLAF